MPDELKSTPTRVALAFLAFVFVAGRLDLPTVGYLAVALATVVIGSWLLVRERPPALIGWLGFLVGFAVALPQVLGLMRGQPIDLGQLVFGAAIAVAAWSAAVPPPTVIRWSVLGALAGVVWAGLAAGVAALLGLFSYALYAVPGHDRDAFGIGQLRGVMPHPNTMGLFAGLALVLAYRQVLTDLRNRRRRGWAVALIVLLPAALALLWSQSRTSAIATVAGLVVASLPLRKDGRGWLSVLVAVGAMVMVGLPLVVAALTDYDFNGRELAWQYAAQEFQRSPLWGYGSEFFTSTYWSPYRGLFWYPDNAHNLVMQAVGQAGAVGLFALAGTLGVMALTAVRAARWDWQWSLIVFTMFCVLGGQEATLSIPVRSGIVLTMAVLAAGVMMRDQSRQSRSNQEAVSSAKSGFDADPVAGVEE